MTSSKLSQTPASIKDIFTYGNFVHAVSGAAGGFFAMTVFYPLDTARVILQVDSQRVSKGSPYVIAEIYREGGLESVYRGWFPVISSLFCSNFIYFYSYNALKILLWQNKQPSPAKDMLTASLAGVINVLITTPMWVVNTRLKLQGASLKTKRDQTYPRYDGIIDAFRKIIATEGIGALWNGTVPSLLLVSNPVVHFMVYEALKRRLKRTMSREDLPAFILFLIGAVAKAVATVVTYPIQTIQTKLRAQFNVQENGAKSSPVTFQSLVMSILRTNGILGLHKGMEAKLLQTVCTAALMFLTYEKISRTIFNMMGASPK